MFAYIWPICLAVFSNIVYQICAKEVPEQVHPFASLTITYAVAAVVTGIIYYILADHGNLLKEYSQINPAPFILGIVIVGLEVGMIYAYKAGWPVSTAVTVQSAFLAVALIFVGFFLYKEALTASKIFGVVICMVGLYFINK